jgi:DNA-binding response OmpR family regulator
MIALRLLSRRLERRAWLASILSVDPALTVVGQGPDLDSLAGRGQPGVRVIFVDLDQPLADESRFWAALHISFPGAGLVALADVPIEPRRLEAALHAGAHYLLDWNEPEERFRRTAHAASAGQGFIPLGSVLTSVVDYFQAAGWPARTVRVGHVTVDTQRGALVGGAREIPLTRTELEFTLYLAAHAGRIVSVNELARAVWRQTPEWPPPANQVKLLVKRLRQKIELDPAQPQYILARRGYGYYMPRSVVD